MDNKINKYIAVAYKLYITKDGNTELVEEATTERPFTFITGLGFALEDFEKNVMNVEDGGDFDFVLTKEQAYGEIYDDRIIDLDISIFTVNGKFDSDYVQVGAVIPLQNDEGQRFFGKVLEIADTYVKLDMNHPLAGNDLHFIGSVIENREATNKEIESLINHMSGGCSCGCDDCSGGCDGKEHGEGCGCGQCH